MPNPQWRIWVDWDADGVWSDPGKDLTADVMALHWSWGKSLGAANSAGRRPTRNSSRNSSNRLDRAGAAGLELTLRNHDGKYSPDNAASTLAGKVQAGRKVWAAFAYPYDNFDGADLDDLSGRSTPVGAGLSWTKQTSGSSGFEIFSRRVRAVTGGGTAIYTLDFGEADAQVGFYYRRGSDGHSGVILRYVSLLDHLRVRFGDTGTVLEDITWGYPTNLSRGAALTAGINYFIEIEMHGSSVRLFATDLDGGGAERKQILDGSGAAGNPSATDHGLWHDGTDPAATSDTDADTDYWGEYGGWRSFFYGSLEHIAPGRDTELGDVCRLRAADELERLGRIRLFNLLTGTSLNSGAIANRVLTWAGFSIDHRHTEDGRTLIAAEPRALWNTGPLTALYALQEEEDGLVYLDGRGHFRLESAAHRKSAPHTGARATLRDRLADSPYFSHLVWDDGAEEVENAITFRYQLGVNRGLQEIWRLREVPAIPAGETRDFLAESGSYDVVDGVNLPLASTDYTANSQADGLGTDLTDGVTVSLPYASGGESAGDEAKYQGKGALVRVENGHATATAYITLLRLQADSAYQDYAATSYRAEATGSQDDCGVRSRTVNCRFIDNYAAARQGAEARLARKGVRRTGLTLTLPNGDGANLVQMVHRVLSDRITVISSDQGGNGGTNGGGNGGGNGGNGGSSLGINGDFFIEGMELDASARTGEVTARWLARKA